VNVVALPTAMLWAGHGPDLCVRHGAPATVRMSFYDGMIRNWPYCVQCVKSRRINRVLAVAALVLPLLVMFVGIVLFSGDPKASGTFIDATWVLLPAGIITFWYLVFRFVTPSGLAKAKLTDSNMWLVMQGVHPAFMAHANDLIQRTGAAHVSPTGQLIQPDVFVPRPGQFPPPAPPAE
jgi:hypothetical protein